MVIRGSPESGRRAGTASILPDAIRGFPESGRRAEALGGHWLGVCSLTRHSRFATTLMRRLTISTNILRSGGKMMMDDGGAGEEGLHAIRDVPRLDPVCMLA